MSLVLPENIVDAVLTRLNDNAGLLTYKDKEIRTIRAIASLPEDLTSAQQMGFKPPWIGVYFFEGDANSILANGEAFEVEMTLGVICSSSPNYKTSIEAVYESFNYAKLVHKILLTAPPHENNYEMELIDGSSRIFSLRSHKTPREIILANSSMSLTVARFNYDYTE